MKPIHVGGSDKYLLTHVWVIEYWEFVGIDLTIKMIHRYS